MVASVQRHVSNECSRKVSLRTIGRKIPALDDDGLMCVSWQSSTLRWYKISRQKRQSHRALLPTFYEGVQTFRVFTQLAQRDDKQRHSELDQPSTVVCQVKSDRVQTRKSYDGGRTRYVDPNESYCHWLNGVRRRLISLMIVISVSMYRCTVLIFHTL